VVTPLPLLEQHGADAVRYWAANGRPGTDTAVDEGQMKVGRRLAIKVLNASRFALGRLADEAGAIEVPGPEAITVPLDRAMAAGLAGVVAEATAAFEAYDYARAIERTEAFFWSFCDDYLELVKTRAYADPAQPGPASARAALALALSTQLRLFAPFLPFVTEEVWSWWKTGSVHRAAWPTPTELEGPASGADPRVLEVVAEVLGTVRRAKTTAKQSMRAGVAVLTVTDTAERIDALLHGVDDLKDAGGVAELVTAVGSEGAIDVVLDTQD